MDVVSQNTGKESIFKAVENYLIAKGLSIKKIDKTRPWGGFFVIEESSLLTFSQLFFPDFEVESSLKEQPLSPKVLLVAPGKRLSWQYHHRRSEIWSIADGTVGIIMSDSDEQTPVQTFKKGDQVKINQGERHRLVGLDGWGVVAEIWKHSDPEDPSNENDIVRVEDDFGR
ncbi:phosphoheptose isomerase [Rhodohalobacter sp. 614A]|uniref:phosphoheptose isomerase n=1 Tax=Rhodohalobacter sp. 614A TaxID=2908649 RepID=UPI001F331856|nr:phosphoheptose isomerase [Rhodohalobacter sp. 614A]